MTWLAHWHAVVRLVGKDNHNLERAMNREPGFLEVMALVCTVIAAILAIADWMLRLSII
jgi:hypothetical protein